MADGTYSYVRTGGGSNQVGREARMRVQADARKAVAQAKLPRQTALSALHAAGVGCEKWLAVVGAVPSKWLLISPRKTALVIVTVDAATMAGVIDLPTGAHVMPAITWPVWLGDDSAIGQRLPDGRLELRRGRGWLRLDQTRTGYLQFWAAAIPPDGTGEIVDRQVIAKWLDGCKVAPVADKAQAAADADAGNPSPKGKFKRAGANWRANAALVSQAIEACGGLQTATLRRLPEANGTRDGIVTGNGQLWLLHG